MKKIIAYILLLLAVMLTVRCNAEEDNAIADQRSRITTYLENNAEEDLWSEISGVFRYRIPGENAVQSTATEIERGDSVYFYFAGYEFTSTRQEPTFYTNLDYLIEERRLAGQNVIFMSDEPEKVKIGDTKLIRALEIGLTGCYQGDSVRLFLTSNLAYGANYVSTLPLDSSVEYAVLIDKVIKQ
ncbi:MAG: FKBP-type peptidyl-prolyl cis-trans isomerase [Alistipes sp.]|nr:FKBP-type peptidyl-prolyl cis-trans isomerase [Alistipes sp.]